MRPSPRVALETTLLLHGVPRDDAMPLARSLFAAVRSRQAEPALAAIFAGRPTVALTEDQLREMLAAPDVPKVNAPALGLAIHRRRHGATTVSATLELAAAAGIRVFATGGLGGIHRSADALDVSADLPALTRFPLAVVCSGVKSILDVASTRELLETLAIPVVGFRTDRFPAFYLRESPALVDERFNDEADLAAFLSAELVRARRAVVVCQPVPDDHAIDPREWEAWLALAERAADGARGPRATPAILASLHLVSAGATLRANIALATANARLAAGLAVAMATRAAP